ncbi:hypothetical protein HYH02_000799 [Chlamydomonas schloesseri]|uniref:sphinganine-1-phosphate aldolase n=1 Tax=Chlamydomonas schloesseri TaxID=2026947 RepID=A0A836BD91_9CHLO|nr:hypothetical protein HYH02_000799 [Chlamydomonas schloesseri]|eukprot:KAG2454973.1 hypothetical protein HYH02_000799 [Chlamydomonas schloesseri]
MREHLQVLQAQGRHLLAQALERIPPDVRSQATDAIAKAYEQAAPLLARGYAVAEPHVIVANDALARAREQFNQSVADLDAATLVVATVLVLLALNLVLWAVRRLARPFTERGVLPVLFDTIRSLPPLSGIIAKEKAKMRQKLLSSRDKAVPGGGPRDTLTSLPLRGTPAEEVAARLQRRALADVQLGADGQSRLSGAVYMAAHSPHRQLLDSTVAAFSLTNPLHADSFPSVRQMEAEVVAMTAGLLGGGPAGPAPQVCGAMTSGGTESILSAVKASRDYMAARRGVRQPEMIIGVSAHAAYWKAAEYFNIKLHVVPVGPDFRLRAADVRRRLNANTVLVVASAPGFPHGLVDDVKGIAGLAARAGICCHVDACLGGFCLPFVRKLGSRVPPFDFAVRGVTSMSVDTHKFGMAHKGTSVVLYRTPELRRHQFTQITDWSGGLYISPGLAGSRNGALIASAWASLVHLGEEGLLAATARIMAARDELVRGIGAQVPELEVIGEPEMGVVAFRPRPGHPARINIYVLNDHLTQQGWHMNALQNPPALHFCFTYMNSGMAPALVAALRAGVDALAAAGPAAAAAAAKDGSAPLYGMANVSPDRGMIGEFLVAYQDVMLMP